MARTQGIQITAELSVYADRDWRGRGVGTLLMNGLMNGLKKTDIREVLCIVAVDDEVDEGPAIGFVNGVVNGDLCRSGT